MQCEGGHKRAGITTSVRHSALCAVLPNPDCLALSPAHLRGAGDAAEDALHVTSQVLQPHTLQQEGEGGAGLPSQRPHQTPAGGPAATLSPSLSLAPAPTLTSMMASVCSMWHPNFLEQEGKMYLRQRSYSCGEQVGGVRVRVWFCARHSEVERQLAANNRPHPTNATTAT